MNKQLSLFDTENDDTKITILLSLREEYYNQMVDGSKKYEYRTRFLKEETLAYIYISKTLKKIVAKIEFGKPIIGDAKAIATIAEKEQPGCYQDMIDYMYKDIGYAIPVKRIIPIEEVNLDEIKKIFPDFVPPQSYYILDKKHDLLEYLNSRKGKKYDKRW